jgi:hypothetical protein
MAASTMSVERIGRLRLRDALPDPSVGLEIDAAASLRDALDPPTGPAPGTALLRSVQNRRRTLRTHAPFRRPQTRPRYGGN